MLTKIVLTDNREFFTKQPIIFVHTSTGTKIHFMIDGDNCFSTFDISLIKFIS